jgi:hypothetical protein
MPTIEADHPETVIGKDSRMPEKLATKGTRDTKGA